MRARTRNVKDDGRSVDHRHFFLKQSEWARWEWEIWKGVLTFEE